MACFLIGCAHLTLAPDIWRHGQLLKSPKAQVCRVMSLIFPAPQEKRQDAERQQQGSRSAETSPTDAGAAPAGESLLTGCVQQYKSPPGYPSWGCMLAAELNTRIFQGGVPDSQELPSEYA